MAQPTLTPDPITAARALIGNPGLFRPRVGDEDWTGLVETAWDVLRLARPPVQVDHTHITVIPRALFEAHSRRHPLISAGPNTGDAA